MSNYLDKWNEFLEEEDTYDDEVEKRNEESRKQGAEKMGLEEAMDPKKPKPPSIPTDLPFVVG